MYKLYVWTIRHAISKASVLYLLYPGKYWRGLSSYDWENRSNYVMITCCHAAWRHHDRVACWCYWYFYSKWKRPRCATSTCDKCHFTTTWFGCGTWLRQNNKILSALLAHYKEIPFIISIILWGESIGHFQIPLKNASDSIVWCFLCCWPEQTVEERVRLLEVWYAMSLMWRRSDVLCLFFTSLYKIIKKDR